MAVDKSDLKFYLTGSEPGTTQASTAQSIGGHLSTTPFNPATLLSSAIDLYGTNITVDSAITNPYVLIGDEVVHIASTVGLSLTASERASIGTFRRFHDADEPLYGVSQDNLFNNSFSSDKKQYRCIAVKNQNSSSTFFDLQFYFKYGSRNANSTLKMAVEVPSTEIVTGTATSGSTISLVDSSKEEQFEDELDGNYLVVTSGANVNLGRQIAAFDRRTGAFTFLSAFSSPIVTGTTYRVENAPSQRSVSGIIAPETDTTLVSDFSTVSSYSTSLSIDRGDRINGPDLHPYEIVYLWVERTLGTNQDEYLDNRIVITASYRTS
jgi:hypothetical protein